MTEASWFYGWNVCMNPAGDKLVIGAPGRLDFLPIGAAYAYTFNYTTSSWDQLGSTLFGQASTGFGIDVGMNYAGDKIVVGEGLAGSDDSGAVNVYSWNGTSWNQQGTVISGISANEQFGTCVAMNSAGDIVAATADNGSNIYSYISGGAVRVYKWNSTAWIQVGNTINGTDPTEALGRSISINASGDRIVVGSWSSQYHTMYVYYWNGSSWIIEYTYVYDEQFTNHLSMNAAGDIIVASKHNGCILFSRSGSTWTRTGSIQYLGFLTAAAINSTGDYICICTGVQEKIALFKLTGSTWSMVSENKTALIGASSRVRPSVDNNGKIVLGAPLLGVWATNSTLTFINSSVE